MAYHITAIERFIADVFKGFVAFGMIIFLGSSAGLFILSPIALMAFMVSLLIMGCAIYIASDYTMRQASLSNSSESFSEDQEEQPAPKKDEGISLEMLMLSVLGAELASVIAHNSAFEAIFEAESWTLLVLAGGIVFYYMLTILSFSLCRYFSGSNEGEKKRYYDPLIQAQKKFFYGLLSIIPQVIVTSLLLNKIVMIMLASNMVVAAPIGLTLCAVVIAVAAYSYCMKNPQQDKTVDEAALKSTYGLIHTYIKNFMVKLVVGLVLSACAGLLLLNVPYLVTSSVLVISIIGALLLMAAVYTTHQQHSALLAKHHDSKHNPPQQHSGSFSNIESLVVTHRKEHDQSVDAPLSNDSQDNLDDRYPPESTTHILRSDKNKIK